MEDQGAHAGAWVRVGGGLPRDGPPRKQALTGWEAQGGARDGHEKPQEGVSLARKVEKDHLVKT